jgi:histidine triad (HIT) family protein
MSASHAASDCSIWRKHRSEVTVPGGAVYEDERVYAGHAAVQDGPHNDLGSLFVEAKRHVPGLAELDDAAAQALL